MGLGIIHYGGYAVKPSEKVPSGTFIKGSTTNQRGFVYGDKLQEVLSLVSTLIYLFFYFELLLFFVCYFLKSNLIIQKLSCQLSSGVIVKDSLDFNGATLSV